MSKFFNDIFYIINDKECKDVCLISHDQLETNYITLECNHKFNYNDLYNEIVKQKTVKNYCEIQKLQTKQLKCPYCRNVQNKLLPLRDGYNKKYGVNQPNRYCMTTNKCNYIFTKGKNKDKMCNISCNSAKCKNHTKVKCLSKTKKGIPCKNLGKYDGYCKLHCSKGVKIS